MIGFDKLHKNINPIISNLNYYSNLNGSHIYYYNCSELKEKWKLKNIPEKLLETPEEILKERSHPDYDAYHILSIIYEVIENKLVLVNMDIGAYTMDEYKNWNK